VSADGLAILGDGLIRPTLLFKGFAEIEMRIDIVFLQADSLLERSDALI
jgi:hypothetical protein